MEIVNLNDWFQEIWHQTSSYFIQCFKNCSTEKNWYSKSELKKIIHLYRSRNYSEMSIVTMKVHFMYATGC